MNILLRLFPSLGKRKAMKTAMKHGLPELDMFEHWDGTIYKLNIYAKPTEPCWIIRAPWCDGKDDDSTLRSSRVIMVSKASGKVLYDGSANDEG